MTANWLQVTEKQVLWGSVSCFKCCNGRTERCSRYEPCFVKEKSAKKRVIWNLQTRNPHDINTDGECDIIPSIGHSRPVGVQSAVR